MATKKKKPVAKRKAVAKKGSRAKKSTHSPRRSRQPSPSPKAQPRAPVPAKDVEDTPDSRITAPQPSPWEEEEPEVDEPRERAGASDDEFRLENETERDAIAEELGETFVENVTGADDAAAEHRDQELTDEEGGPFVDRTAKGKLPPRPI